ncbi:hypothetical protein RugamoR64_55830 [Duganella rhizosphaerae]|uniref:hypothetical protein n=1 Tax=Duganella rhizosphaerae TaxID=2885763 RepID=UPI0030E9D7BC
MLAEPKNMLLGQESASPLRPSLEALLPAASFEPFATRKLHRATLLWSNQASPVSFDPDDFSYCLPLPEEPDDAYDATAPAQIFLAERYGGNGISSNGGGVRCGLRGQIQVKGIGRNPLAGTDADYWHSHGAASLEEGIREAVWGEVCHIALPFGGVRTLGLIATGTSAPYAAPNGPRQARRCLILREAALRPAHYMRAIFQKTAAGQPFDGMADARRAALAIEMIGAGLESAYGGSLRSADDLNRYLCAMTSRFARQLACAYAKRIFHGGLSGSNICVDGRWIDYGTPTTVSDYGRVIVAKNMPDLWRQHTALYDTLENFHCYLLKYLPAQLTTGILAATAWVAHFHAELTARFPIEFGKLAGIPEADLEAIDAAVVQRFFAICQRTIASGNREPFKLSPTHVSAMPAKMGDFHLNTLLQTAARADTASAMDELLQPGLPADDLRAELVSSYMALRAAWLQQQGAGADAAAYLKLNAWRCNVPFDDLYRPVFDQSIARLIAEDGEIAPFVERYVRKAQCIIAEPTAGAFRIDALLPAQSGKVWVRLEGADALLRQLHAQIPGAAL